MPHQIAHFGSVLNKIFILFIYLFNTYLTMFNFFSFPMWVVNYFDYFVLLLKHAIIKY